MCLSVNRVGGVIIKNITENNMNNIAGMYGTYRCFGSAYVLCGFDPDPDLRSGCKSGLKSDPDPGAKFMWIRIRNTVPGIFLRAI